MPPHLATMGSDIAAVCREEPVRLAYVYGSYAAGRPDGDSDIDIAILADEKLTKQERFDLRLKLAGKIAKKLSIPEENVDTVIFQDAPALLKYNAVFKGICVYERDRSERNLFILKVEQEYDDERYYLEREGKIALERILSQP